MMKKPAETKRIYSRQPEGGPFADVSAAPRSLPAPAAPGPWAVSRPRHIMIERYTLKFAPPIGQKELQKAFEEGKELTPEHQQRLSMMKVRIEIVCDYGDLKKIDGILKELAKR